MPRSCWFLAVLALLSASPALAQYSGMIAACRWDGRHLCAGLTPDGGQLAQCIKANFQSLTGSCQAALAKITAVREACEADVERQCRSIKPGAGRIVLCVKAHYAALSEPCKDAIGHAAERNLRAH